MASAPHVLISGEDVNVSVRPESSPGNTTIQGSYARVAGVNRSSVVADDGGPTTCGSFAGIILS